MSNVIAVWFDLGRSVLLPKLGPIAERETFNPENSCRRISYYGAQDLM